jgi:hypothetical protein
MRNGCHAGWVFVLLPACFHPSYDHPRCGPQGECPSGLTCSAELICEAPGGTPDAPSTCFGSFVTVCFTTLADVPTLPVILPIDLTIEIDTDSSTMCDQHNDQMGNYCVIAGAGFTLAAGQSIRGYGSKPLVVLSTTTMTLEATSTVDVSSNRTVGPLATRAGANSSLCTSGAAPELVGGGYGGSFGGKGGDGERLGGAATSGVAAAALTTPPTRLRGGCPGGTGDASGGVGGSGGGAVALIAGTSIQIDGSINASGAGGRGGPATQSGAGGGGSGGMIVLDTPSITATGPLFANGGGGGQGGTGAGKATMGDDGGESPAPPTPAPAGSNPIEYGGHGGPGSAGTSRLSGDNGGSYPAGPYGGGGGGGGGAGFIRARGVTTNIAPPSFAP